MVPENNCGRCHPGVGGCANLFRAVPIDDKVYWDGLFSQNPPVRDLPDAQPDEIWVVQVNPISRASESRSGFLPATVPP